MYANNWDTYTFKDFVEMELFWNFPFIFAILHSLCIEGANTAFQYSSLYNDIKDEPESQTLIIP